MAHKKISIFIHSLSTGGAERVTVNIANWLIEKQYDVFIITMDAQDQDFYELNPNVRRMSLNMARNTKGINKLFTNYNRVKSLRQILTNERPDVVLGMMTTSIVLLIIASFGLPVKVFGSERNYPPREYITSAWNLLRRLVYRFADGHIAQTQETAKWLVKNTGAKNIHVIHNPVVWPLPLSKPQIKTESVVLADRKIILSVGTKVEQKGFDLLLQAFSGLTNTFTEWDLVILGIDSNSSEIKGGGLSIKALAEELEVSTRVHLPGRVGNIVDWFDRADIFVLSSRYEGFPNVLIEAMASGCPSLAFDCDTGPRDIIIDGINGILVPSEDIDKLRVGLIKLIEDESLRYKYAKEGAFIKDILSEEKIMNQWEKALNSKN